MSEFESILVQRDEWDDAIGWAGAFLAGFKSTQTRRSYRRDLDCWFTFCASHALHPYRELRRIHVEVYLRQLEAQQPQPANATLYRRIATLSSCFGGLRTKISPSATPPRASAARNATPAPNPGSAATN